MAIRSKNYKGRIPPYVFRGTTIGFPGGTNIQKLGYSCTTWNPIKATLFAIECARRHPETAVVYVIKTGNIAYLKPLGNVLKKYEEEVVWPILPKDLYKLSEGYVTIQNMLQALTKNGISVDGPVSLETLTRLCRECEKMTTAKIESLVKDIVLQK